MTISIGSRCTRAAVLITTLAALPMKVYAHDPQYVDELEILSGEALLTKKIGQAIVAGAKKGASDVLSDVARGLIGGLLDSYIPGISSLLGLGGSSTQSQQVVLDAIRSSTVQLSDRVRELQDTIAAGNVTDIVALYDTGETQYATLIGMTSVHDRLTNLGLLEQAFNNLLQARYRIQDNLFRSPNRLQAIEHLQTHIVITGLLGAVAAERARLTAIKNTFDAARRSGRVDDFLLTLSGSEQLALAERTRLAIESQMTQAIDGTKSVFAFYQRVADDGILRAEVESWFSPLTHPTMCWDPALDGSFDRPQYYQNSANWDTPCCTLGSSWWNHQDCVGYADVFWYYYVRAPNAQCYRYRDRLFEAELAEDCNLFFVRSQGSAWTASYDNFIWPAHGADYDGYNDHKDAVYAAFVAREYAPVSIFLDSLWASLGRTSARPRNKLDNDIDFTITDVPGLPAHQDVYGKPKALNFSRFPGWSSALFSTIGLR